MAPLATKKIDITLDGTLAFSDEVLRFPGSGAVTLQHDYFEANGFVIRDAAAGGGTLLVRDTDYTLGSEHVSLGARCTAVQSPTVVQVFNTVTITNATYQTVDLFITGNYVADAIEGQDVVDPAKRTQLEGLLANDLEEGNHLHTDAEGELFELATPDCVSSLGRRPTADSFVHFEPGMVTADGRPRYANPVARWPAEAVADPQDIELTADPTGVGRGVIGVFAEAWNATPSAFHMGSSDWGITNITLATSERAFKSHRFTTLTSTVNGANANSNGMVVEAAENHIQPWSIVLAYGGTDAELRLRDVTGAADRLNIDINFTTKAVTVNTGTLVYERWYGNDIVELGGWTAALVTSQTNVMEWWIYPSAASTDSIDVMHPTFTYQTNDYQAPLPWRGYGAGAGRLLYPFNDWANSGTVEFWYFPLFGRLTAADAYLIDSRDPDSPLATADYVNLRYDIANDRYELRIQDDATNLLQTAGPAFAGEAHQVWTHLFLTWDKAANDIALYIDGVLATADTTTGSGITNIDMVLSKWLSVGTSPTLAASGESNAHGYVTDLRVRMGTVETPATHRHFDRDRPWYRKDRMLGDNGTFRLDRFGNFWAAGATG